MKNTKSNRKPRNRYAIFYKSHGKFIGPWGGTTLSKRELKEWRREGALEHISNYVLKSPLELRRRVA